MIYICLGLVPFAVDLLPKGITADITRPGVPYLVGLLMGVIQVLAGAAGAVLDIFFQKSELDRRAIVATKAMGQTIAHFLRMFYFGSFAAAYATPVPWWAYAGGVVLAIVGASLAARVLERMTDRQFRRWSYILIYAISIVFVVRGVWLLADG